MEKCFTPDTNEVINSNTARDYRNRTPLFVAAELDRSVAAKYLLDMQADATAKGEKYDYFRS